MQKYPKQIKFSNHNFCVNKDQKNQAVIVMERVPEFLGTRPELDFF